MKSGTKLTALLIALWAASSYAVANGTFRDVLEEPAAKSRLAAKSLLVGVAMAGTRVVGVGQHGHIVYSDDRGGNWTQASVPVGCDLVAVNFPTARQGWAVGHDGVVLHTSDGGGSWEKQFDGRAAARLMVESYAGSATAGLTDEIKKFGEQGADKPFLDVWFENETTGYIVGAFSLIFATSDGGKSWVPLYDRIDNPKRYHLYAIRPVGGELYVTAEQGTVFRLERKSGRFLAVKTPYNGTFFGITGKPGAAIAFGMRGNAYRSRDRGLTWQKVETGEPAGLTGGTVTGDGRIVLVSQGGNVLVSGDAGTNFTRAKIEKAQPAAGVVALDAGTLALVGPLGAQVQTIK